MCFKRGHLMFQNQQIVVRGMVNILMVTVSAKGCTVGTNANTEVTVYCKMETQNFSNSKNFSDECWTDQDCGSRVNGKCQDLEVFHYPRRVCYCEPGWFGPGCQQSSLPKVNI